MSLNKKRILFKTIKTILIIWNIIQILFLIYLFIISNILFFGRYNKNAIQSKNNVNVFELIFVLTESSVVVKLLVVILIGVIKENGPLMVSIALILTYGILSHVSTNTWSFTLNSVLFIILQWLFSYMILFCKKGLFIRYESIEFELKRKKFQLSEFEHNPAFIDNIVEYEELEIEEKLEKGNFGQVYKAKLCKGDSSICQVAVKFLITLDSMDVEYFLNEAAIMKEFDHVNVLKMIGISSNEDKGPIIIMPFIEHGNLLQFVQKNEVDVRQIISFSSDVSRGMEYLSNKNIVHRDLAARNCLLDLVDNKLMVKISDFGLTRDIHKKGYYRVIKNKQKLPFRWMAPESLQSYIFNEKTDVWSFGILMWELSSGGKPPYSQLNKWSCVLNFIKRGERLSWTHSFPKDLFLLLNLTWSKDPEVRPNFTKLRIALEQSLSNLDQDETLEIVIGGD